MVVLGRNAAVMPIEDQIRLSLLIVCEVIVRLCQSCKIKEGRSDESGSIQIIQYSNSFIVFRVHCLVQVCVEACSCIENIKDKNPSISSKNNKLPRLRQ